MCLGSDKLSPTSSSDYLDMSYLRAESEPPEAHLEHFGGCIRGLGPPAQENVTVGSCIAPRVAATDHSSDIETNWID